VFSPGWCINTPRGNSHFVLVGEDEVMSNITDRERFNRLDTVIWKRRRVDEKGRIVLPVKLRRILGVSPGSVVVLVQVYRKNGRDNEYLLEVLVDRGGGE